MRKEECTGCMACYNVCIKRCIKMKKDFDGCYYPYVNTKKCVGCNKCIQVCPVQNKNKDRAENRMQNAYVGYCREEDIRKKSSSGGVSALAAEWCIDRKGIVFGAGYQGTAVVHSFGKNASEIARFKGSKYVQSNIRTTYKEAKEFLDEGRYVLFTGLPCQIEGLKAYLGREYKKLYTIDIICHGVGAPGIWEKYIHVFHKNKEIIDINFKNKDAGWNHEQFVMRYSNGKEYRKKPLEDYYTYGFNTNIFLRPSCYQCKFKGMNRRSDLTIGDAWGVERYAPRFRDDKGCSLVFIHSAKGQELFKEISERMVYDVVDGEKAVRQNPRMMSSVPRTPKRRLFYNNLKKYPFWISMMLMKKEGK